MLTEQIENNEEYDIKVILVFIFTVYTFIEHFYLGQKIRTEPYVRLTFPQIEILLFKHKDQATGLLNDI